MTLATSEVIVNQVTGMPLGFPIGVPGFEDHHGFMLGALGPEYGPYLGLMSTLEGGPGFVVEQPAEVGIEMTIDIDDFHQSLIGAEEEKDILVLLVANVRDDGPPTVNTLAPIIINTKNWRCAQVIQKNAACLLEQDVDVPLRDEARLS